MEDSLHVVVLAAGEGKRMNSAHPKVLQPVGGQPMLSHLLFAAAALQPARIHLVIGAGADRIRQLYADFDRAPLAFVEQTERLGTGHAVQQALPAIPAEARVLVLPGDMPLIRPESLSRLGGTDSDLALLSFITATPDGYGRILRDGQGRVTGIREEPDASEAERAIEEVNSGVLIARAGQLSGWLEQVGNANRQGEYYLTDCATLAAAEGARIEARVIDDPSEALGANDRLQLAGLEAAYQQRRRLELLDAGVSLSVPESIQVRGAVHAGRDVELDAGVILEGTVELGDGTRIGAGCVLRNCRLAAGTRIHPYCVLDGVETTGACEVGPFARLRPGTVLEAESKIGNFVETKNARLGRGARASHLTYVGDANVGPDANLGAGTITCNFDGAKKHHTEIGAEAFIGSNSALVAPVTIGRGATVGAGSVVSGHLPADQLTLTRAPQRTIPGWKRPRKS